MNPKPSDYRARRQWQLDARVVLALLDSEKARTRLDAAGVDRTSIRLSLQLKEVPRG